MYKNLMALIDAYAKVFSSDYMEAIRLRNAIKGELEKNFDNAEEAAHYDELNRGYSQDRI